MSLISKGCKCKYNDHQRLLQTIMISMTEQQRNNDDDLRIKNEINHDHGSSSILMQIWDVLKTFILIVLMISFTIKIILISDVFTF